MLQEVTPPSLLPLKSTIHTMTYHLPAYRSPVLPLSPSRSFLRCPLTPSASLSCKRNKKIEESSPSKGPPSINPNEITHKVLFRNKSTLVRAAITHNGGCSDVHKRLVCVGSGAAEAAGRVKLAVMPCRDGWCVVLLLQALGCRRCCCFFLLV